MQNKDPNETINQIRSLFQQYYGPNENYLSLLTQFQAIEGSAQYLKKLSKFGKKRMDDAFTEMVFALLFSSCGFKVTLIPESSENGENRPDFKIVNDSIIGLVEVKHIASKDFNEKLKVSSKKQKKEIFEKYGSFEKTEQILWDIVFDKLKQLQKYSQNEKYNALIIAVWNSVDEIEEIDVKFSSPKIISMLKEENRYTTDILLIYGSAWKCNSFFHAIPLNRKSNVLTQDLIEDIERKSIDDIFGIHRRPFLEWLELKK